MSHPREPQPDFLDDGAAAGCGRISRDELELAALSRSDRDVPVDERTIAHLVICKSCLDAVDRLHGEHRILKELSVAVRMPEPESRNPAVAEDGVIPGYRLGDELHRGGQGAVFAAEQIATRRRCAVKMLLSGRFATPAQRMRFEREVEVVAALRHPSIVTLYESGLSRRGEPWFAMEFVEGERLDEHLARTDAGPREIAVVMRRVSDAIAYAHRRGVIHRDLKPGNILIDRDGVPRILDFGLARAAPTVGAHDPRSGSTLAGEFLGTFAYAAPEQLAGDPTAVDSRCDLYALGVVFYEALARERPFDGARSIGELVSQKTGRAPRRPSEIAAKRGVFIDSDLDVIVLRLLSPDPARRYETAAALEEDLARHLDGRPILAREDSVAYVVTRTMRRHWLASTGALVFAVVTIAAGIALAILYARSEEQLAAAERARERFKQALTAADPEQGEGSSEMNVRQYLRIVEEELRVGLDEEPLEVGDLLLTLGMIQLGFQDPGRAEETIRTSYALLQSGHAQGKIDDRRMAAAEIGLARLCFLEGDYAGAEEAYRRAWTLYSSALGSDGIETVNTQRELASVLREQGEYGDARLLLDDAFTRSERFPNSKEASIVRAGVRNGRAVLAAELGDDELALTEFKGTLAQLARYVKPDDYRWGRTLFSVANMEFRLGRNDEAEMHAREALSILRLRKGDEARWTMEAAALVQQIELAKRE